MKELEKQIAEIIRRKINHLANTLMPVSENLINISTIDATNRILSLPIAPGKLWVEKECEECGANAGKIFTIVGIYIDCPNCQDTGIIRREATWGDVDIGHIIKWLTGVSGLLYSIDKALTLSDGSKLVWRDK